MLIKRKEIDGAKFIGNWKSNLTNNKPNGLYYGGMRGCSIQGNDTIVTMFKKVCDSIIGYTANNGDVSNHYNISQATFDVLGVDPHKTLMEICGNKYTWRMIGRWTYRIYAINDKNNGIANNRPGSNINNEIQSHHLTKHGKQIDLPAEVHELYHGCYGRTENTEEEFKEFIEHIKSGFYKKYLTDYEIEFVKSLNI